MNLRLLITMFKCDFFKLKVRLLVAVLILLFVPLSGAQEYAPEKLQWSAVKYSGSKFFLSLDTSVKIDLVNKESVSKELIVPPEGKGKTAQSEQIVKIGVNNTVVGSQTEFTVWVEPDTTVLQRTSVYGGVKEWYRTYRFMSDRVFSDKRKPANDNEEGEPWDTWTNLMPGFYALDKTEQGVVVSEAEALFYLIGVAGLEKKGDKVTLNVYDRSGVIAATVKVAGTKRVLVDYNIIQGGTSTRFKKKITALEVVLEAKPIREGGNLEEFKFLGYKDDIRMLINPELNAILQISGSIEYVGEVTIRLQEITLKP